MYFLFCFPPPDANSPSGKEGKPVENGVIVNEAPGKLMHRCALSFLFCFVLIFCPFTQMWTNSNLVFILFVGGKSIMPRTAS